LKIKELKKLTGMMLLKNSKSGLLSIIVSTIQIAMIGPFFFTKEKIKYSTAEKVVLMAGCVFV